MKAYWILWGVLLLLFPLVLTAQQFQNPIIRGSSPDPSICRVGDDFYLVNSSFEYFPGLPLYHSRDLVNWDLVGYGLSRRSQCSGAVNLRDVPSDGGIHAPSLRYHDGLFYLISTNVYYDEERNETDFVNFILTAESIEGPWSEPLVVEGAPGIDPDIFFDDDGRVWYVGTHAPQNPNFPGEGEIWLQEISRENWQLTGERYYLWRGACGGVWAEGPHIYKRNGYYYLMIAEGGTSLNHAVMIAVSTDIRGPYIANDRNPILTSRHLSYDHWATSTGHADLVELADGRWYAVALGIRNELERSSNMGRETFLIPVEWEQEPFEWKEEKYEWPVCSPESGRVEKAYPLPFKNKAQQISTDFYDDFDGDSPALRWNFRRVAEQDVVIMDRDSSYLHLRLQPQAIANRQSCSLLGFRQTESDFEYRSKMHFEAVQEGEEAGIVAIQKDDQYVSFTLLLHGGIPHLRVFAQEGEKAALVAEEAISAYAGHIQLELLSEAGQYRFSFSLDDGRNWQVVAVMPANTLLSKGYTGAFLGLYARAPGASSSRFASYDWVSYRAHPTNAP